MRALNVIMKVGIRKIPHNSAPNFFDVSAGRDDACKDFFSCT
jgi:hypothetical protein